MGTAGSGSISTERPFGEALALIQDLLGFSRAGTFEEFPGEWEMDRQARGFLERYSPAAASLEVSVLMPLTRMIGQPQLCKGGCEAREPAPEDDGSTQPVETVP